MAYVVLVVVLIIGLLIAGAGVLYVVDWIQKGEVERKQAEAAVEWARAGLVNAETNRNAQRDADWRKNMLTFATIMELNGSKDAFYLILGSVAGIVGMVVYNKIVRNKDGHSTPD